MRAKAKNSDRFFAELGNFLGTWGLGVIAVWFQFWNTGKMFLLSSPLLILTLLAGYQSYFSKKVLKRFDTSHIFIIALSGFISSISLIDTMTHLMILSVALVLIHLRNFKIVSRPDFLNLHQRGVVLYSPVGCSIIFPVLLVTAPSEFPVFIFSAVILYITFDIARYEQKLALSIYPIGSVLYVCFKTRPILTPVSAIVAVGAIALIYYLRRKRQPLENRLFERRLWLDEVMTLFSLSLFLRSSMNMEPIPRYLLIMMLFGMLAGMYALAWRPNYGPILRKLLFLNSQGMETIHLDMRRNASLAAASVALCFAIENWNVAYDDYANYLMKMGSFVLTAVLLYLVSKKLHTFLLADLSKIVGALAVIMLFDFIGSKVFFAAPLGITLGAATLQYATIAFVIYTSTTDLNATRQGAWHGILEPRSLVHLRRSRATVFDFISKMPLVGWIIHFTDKVTSSLHASFGKKKTWTISHYAILAVAWFGMISMHFILKNIVPYMLPTLMPVFFGTSTSGQMVNLVIDVISIVVYTSVFYFCGAALDIKYLRLLAFIMAAINLLFLMFSDLGDKSTGATPYFYIAVFFSIMGIFAILYRNPPKSR